MPPRTETPTFPILLCPQPTAKHAPAPQRPVDITSLGFCEDSNCRRCASSRKSAKRALTRSYLSRHWRCELSKLRTHPVHRLPLKIEQRELENRKLFGIYVSARVPVTGTTSVCGSYRKRLGAGVRRCFEARSLTGQRTRMCGLGISSRSSERRSDVAGSRTDEPRERNRYPPRIDCGRWRVIRRSESHKASELEPVEIPTCHQGLDCLPNLQYSSRARQRRMEEEAVQVMRWRIPPVTDGTTS